jgi:hypothetical protein
MAEKPKQRRSYSRRLALIRKTTQDPAHVADKYLSLFGKWAQANK